MWYNSTRYHYNISMITEIFARSEVKVWIREHNQRMKTSRVVILALTLHTDRSYAPEIKIKQKYGSRIVILACDTQP